MKTNRRITVRFGTTLCLSGLFALALAICSTGCLVLPVNSDSGYARTNLNQLTVQQFTPDVSTFEDVVVALGEPDAISSDERTVAYRSEKLIVTWFVATESGSFEGAIHRERFYLLEFDPQARLQNVIQHKAWAAAMTFGGEAMLRPLNLEADAVPANLAREQVRRVYPKCFWYLSANGRQNQRTDDLPVASGRLLLSDSNLFFISNTQLANTDPALKLSLAAVTEARLEKHLFSQFLVVHSYPDACNAFAIWKTNAFGQDGTAMQDAFEFIQSKMKSSKPEK